jgi:hypothetical protein
MKMGQQVAFWEQAVCTPAGQAPGVVPVTSRTKSALEPAWTGGGANATWRTIRATASSGSVGA